MAKSTRGVRRGRRHPFLVPVPGAIRYIRDHDLAPDLSRDARRRLAMLDWHRAHGGNVSRTARHFGYSRPTVYRWLARFERDRLESFEDRGSAPRRRRRPTWTLEQLRAVKAFARPVRAGARTSWSSSCAAPASTCRSRWSAGSWPACADQASCTSRVDDG